MKIKEKLLKFGQRRTEPEAKPTEDTDRRFLSGLEVRKSSSVSEGAKTIARSIQTYATEISTPIDLDDKVNTFINWYFKNMIAGHFTDIGEHHKIKEMKDFIEKMAVWYELRYPDYEINRMMPGSDQECIKVDDVMFRNNSYVNDLLPEDADTKELEWGEFYNASAFIKSLPWQEKAFFYSPRYQEVVYFDIHSSMAHLHLTKNGIVEMSEWVSAWSNYAIRDEEITGLHITRVVELFKERGIALPKNNELEKTIMEVSNLTYQKEEMLNCVMYRIIERGGNRIGPRRAFLFAKEFKRNIDIPMMYGVDYSDPGLRMFINEYIKAGGSLNLECLVGYFERTNKKPPLKLVSIEELLTYYRYTPEETGLHQKLVDILASQVNLDEVKKEEIKRLRLERKLEKSKKNKQ